jgi:hypothetical protein
LTKIIDHPTFLKQMLEKNKQKSREIYDGGSLIQYAFDAEDCKLRIGPYFSEERALSENRYIDMYVALKDEKEFLLIEVKDRNERLLIMNDKYVKEKEELLIAHKLNKSLRAENSRLKTIIDDLLTKKTEL